MLNSHHAFSLNITRTWDDKSLIDDERASISCQLDARGLKINVNASFHNDAAPDTLPGPTDYLWEYEVVELFLLGEDNHYLEVEFGPHGHYLILLLEGIRNRKEMPSLLRMPYETKITGKQWSAFAHLPLALLPPNLTRINAYAMHGQGRTRRYLAAFPVPGPTPDFHQLQFFHPISELNASTTSPSPHQNNANT